MSAMNTRFHSVGPTPETTSSTNRTVLSLVNCPEDLRNHGGRYLRRSGPAKSISRHALVIHLFMPEQAEDQP